MRKVWKVRQWKGPMGRVLKQPNDVLYIVVLVEGLVFLNILVRNTQYSVLLPQNPKELKQHVEYHF